MCRFTDGFYECGAMLPLGWTQRALGRIIIPLSGGEWKARMDVQYAFAGCIRTIGQITSHANIIPAQLCQFNVASKQTLFSIREPHDLALWSSMGALMVTWGCTCLWGDTLDRINIFSSFGLPETMFVLSSKISTPMVTMICCSRHKIVILGRYGSHTFDKDLTYFRH